MNWEYIGPASMSRTAKIVTAISNSMSVKPRKRCIISLAPSGAGAALAHGPAARVADPACRARAALHARLVDGIDEGRHRSLTGRGDHIACAPRRARELERVTW